MQRRPAAPASRPWASDRHPKDSGRWRARVGQVSLVIGILAGLAVIIVGGLRMGWEDRFIYHPLPLDEAADRAARQQLAVEDHTFGTSDGIRLHGWIVRAAPAAPDTPWLLWCHGNAGNISHRAENLRLLVQQGLNVFIFDYRGYGRSEGHPSEAGLYDDAAAAYDYLRAREAVTAGRVVLFGRSLGSAVAAEVALRRPAAGLILETPLASVPAMARSVLPLLPAELLLRSRFDTVGRAARLPLPVLVLIAERDDVVPPSQGHRVYDTLPGPKERWVVPGARHNDTYIVGGSAYLERVTSFVQRATDLGARV